MGMKNVESMIVTKTTQYALIERVEAIMINGNGWKPEGESYTKLWHLGSGEVITVYRQKMVRPKKVSGQWDWSM